METKKEELTFNIYAKEAEAAVLGSLMTFEDALSEVSLILTPEMFYDLRHQCIYAAILKTDNDGIPVDLVSVAEALKKTGNLERAGNYTYLSELTNYSGNVVRVTYYAQVVAQKFVQRELMKFGNQTIQAARDERLDVANVIAQTAANLDRINEVMTANTRITHIDRILEKSLSEALEREQSLKEGKAFGIPTGLTEMDRLLSGFHGGDLIIVAGRPGSGKTSVMLNFLKAAAIAKFPVCAFSLEMTSVRLSDRLILSESGISARDYRMGKFSQTDYEKLSKAQHLLSGLPIFIDDRSGVTMQYIRGIARMMHKRGQCKVLFIDYLQLLSSTVDKKYNREQEIAQISGQAKALAKELNIPVVLLSQLNRDCEKRTDKKPELSDLRESGAIEQDADIVMLVYRPEYYGLKAMDGEPIKNVGKLIVAKHRDGPVGEVKFSYNESLTKIYDFTVGKIPF